jgi:hypothetical protein
MSRAERLEKLRAKLNATEVEFRELLVASLHKCKDGGRGVFLTEARAASRGDVYARLVWPEAKQLEILGQEIDTLRQKLGDPRDGSLYSKYRYYCSLEGPSEPGGAKLASQFLAEIEREKGIR